MAAKKIKSVFLKVLRLSKSKAHNKRINRWPPAPLEQNTYILLDKNSNISEYN